MKITFYSFLILIIVIISVSCKPSDLEIEIYTSDIESASEGEVAEVPVKVKLNLRGKDKKNELPKAKKIVQKYLPSDSKIEIIKGKYGQVMAIESEIPLGTNSSLKKYLKKNKRLVMIVYDKGTLTLKPTGALKKLDKELSSLNFMLGAELPAADTTFRIVSDSKKKVNISATAVYLENKPYLHFAKDLKKRKSVEIVFSGGSGSVYKTISPHVIVKF